MSRADRSGVLALFAAAIFVSAMLLFLVQPMVAKMVLPLLGGSPSVWNTCMVFFQAALLAGYAYSHYLPRLIGLRRHAVVHGVVLLAPALVLPIALRGGAPGPASEPVGWLLAILAASVGLPFLVVATSAPLLQKWFAASGHRASGDPYFLYAASNAGSLLALVCYPLVVEPRLGLAEQGRAWTIGYGCMVVMGVACIGVMLRKGGRGGLTAGGAVATADRAGADPSGCAREKGLAGGAAPGLAGPPAGDDQPCGPLGAVAADGLTGGRRALWVMLAFVPSSLMLGATQYVSTDIAAVPLLWVAPLSLYLLTFIIAFGRGRAWGGAFSSATAIAAIALVLVFMVRNEQARLPVWALLSVHLAALFIVALMCHGRLADLRPGAERLTEFYRWLAVGGVLGGVFNALIAPLVFTSVAEYPIALFLACLLRPRPAGGRGARLSRPAAIALDVGATLGIGAGAFVLARLGAGVESMPLRVLVSAGLPLIAAFLLAPRVPGFAGAVGVLLLVAFASPGRGDDIVLARRTFFGVYRVHEEHLREETLRTLVHGTTTHGLESTRADLAGVPLSYYHPAGPIGQVFAALEHDPRLGRVGLVGLGSGSLAAYGRPGMRMTFHEIDPEVVRIARGRFGYLDRSAAEVSFLIGDGRLTLAGLPDGSYGLLVLDAFSSDAIPVHLLTREAVELYLRKVGPGGIIAFHTSNQYLKLAPVVGRIARSLGAAALVQVDEPPDTVTEETYRYGSEWIIMAHRAVDLRAISRNRRWMQIPDDPRAPLWTDDFSNIVSVFRW
jgi:spermidine synthase